MNITPNEGIRDFYIIHTCTYWLMY